MRLGVCSWSLRPASAADLAASVRAAGLSAVQLALGPLRAGAWDEAATVATLAEAGIAIVSGMLSMKGEDYTSLESIRVTGGLRPTAHWAENLVAAERSADLARRLGLPLVSFHAGWLPHERRDPSRATLVGRLRAVADRFAAQGVLVALETGQESAATLLDVLDELRRPNVGVNFDPANMILYDRGDPLEALEALVPFVRQVHVKDARRTRVKGAWGQEVPVGTGEVDWQAFFALLARTKLDVDLLIEREAGEDRVGDVRAAREFVQRLLGAPA